jgi:tetratricopeptide (TPR) repeat protein
VIKGYGVSPELLCRELLGVPEKTRRSQLLEVASATEGCVDLLLAEAEAATRQDPERALRCVDLTLEIARLRRDQPKESAAWRVRGQCLRALGQHGEALDAFERAAASALQAGDAALAAQVQVGSIDSLSMLGRYDEAIALAQRLEAELHAYGREEYAARVLVNAGVIHMRRDQYAAALECFERARDVLVRSGDAGALAPLQANLAYVLTYLNRTEEAIALYEQARTAFAAQGFGTKAAMVDVNIGFLRYISGEHSAALVAQARARQEFTAHGLQVETAQCDADMADVYRELNLLPEALEAYERAITVLERIPLNYECARAEMGRAAVLMISDRVDDAFAALQHADRIFRAEKNALQRAHVRLIRANMLQAIGCSAEARTEARRAARVLARSGLHGKAAEARFLLAEIDLTEGEDATRRMRRVSRSARGHARTWLVGRAENALGRYYGRRGDAQRAIHHFRAGAQALEQVRTLVVSEELHVSFLRDKLSMYEDLVGALLSRGRERDVREALEFVERSKSRLLLERMQTAGEERHRTADPELAQSSARLAALRAEMCRGYHQMTALEEGDQPRRVGMAGIGSDQLLSLEKAYREALREVELAETAPSNGGFLQASIVVASRLQAALAPDETLVEFYVVREEVCAFVLTRRDVQVRRGFAVGAEVADLSERLRYHLQKGDMLNLYPPPLRNSLMAALQRVLQQLYRQLLAPLEDLLTTEKIVLVPHGVLHKIPFHLLFDGAQYALDRYEILYAPSAAIWYAGVRRRKATPENPGADADASMLLMGIPGPGIEQVAAEVDQIAQLAPDARVFCGENATVEAFRAAAPLVRRIHLAAHALFRADNPLFSGLQFADGWLLARDLYEMALDCDLTTLSACRTGVTFVEPGDELFGLLRGFLAAGVRSLAASMWPADDAATAALMVRFYSLLAQGVPRAAALRASQQQTRALYPHPYYWAAFALFGER